MDSDTQEHIERYKNLYSVYKDFAKLTESLLKSLLEGAQIKVHFTESRAKSIESFENKITRPEKNYADPLNEMPDLAGIRVVLYYIDDVLKVGELIKSQFEVVEEVTEHQQDRYSPDRFGYLSLHYVVLLNKIRSDLPELRRFGGLRAEIQIRTVLQHAWAAVSHVLQYKKESDVPADLQRRLSRLAGLFELADEEFIGIRDKHSEVVESTAQAVKEMELSVKIDAPAVREFVRSSRRFLQAKKLMDLSKFEFEERQSDEYIGTVVEECERIGLETIEKLEAALNHNYGSYVQELVSRLVGEGKERWVVSDGFALWLLLIRTYRDRYSFELLRERGWGVQPAKRVIEAATVE